MQCYNTKNCGIYLQTILFIVCEIEERTIQNSELMHGFVKDNICNQDSFHSFLWLVFCTLCIMFECARTNLN